MERAKFKIDDHVKSKDSCNIEGYVIDAMFSESTGWTYRVQMNSQVFFQPEDNLELVNEYSMEVKIDIAGNVVIATLYEDDGNTKTPLHKGHGHIIHEGEFGIAQAASYACYRLWKSVEVSER